MAVVASGKGSMADDRLDCGIEEEGGERDGAEKKVEEEEHWRLTCEPFP